MNFHQNEVFEGATARDSDQPPRCGGDAGNDLHIGNLRSDLIQGADGIETTPINTTTPVMFDLDASGVKKSVGWLKADDGFLVRDLNGNGLIDTGAELFGDATALRAGGKAANGFAALADLDSNLDGKFTSADTAFAALKVWRDLNQDGVSQANELSTLASLNITSINVAASSHTLQVVNGNTITDLGSYTRGDGSSGGVGDTANSADVNLLTDPFRTEFTTHLDTTAVASLPDMHGSGQVRNLREAATLSPTLVGLLNQFANATTRTARLALMDGILTAWANTSTMATTFSGAYAGHALTVNFQNVTPATPAYQAWADKLALLERFNGRTFNAVPAGTGAVAVNVWTTAQPLLQQSYDHEEIPVTHEAQPTSNDICWRAVA